MQKILELLLFWLVVRGHIPGQSPNLRTSRQRLYEALLLHEFYIAQSENTFLVVSLNQSLQRGIKRYQLIRNMQLKKGELNYKQQLSKTQTMVSFVNSGLRLMGLSANLGTVAMFFMEPIVAYIFIPNQNFRLSWRSIR